MATASSPSRNTTKNRAGRVVLTRPAERQLALVQRLSQAGYDVLSLPALTITPITPTQINETGITSDQKAEVSGDAVVANWQPGEFDALVFVSRAAWQNYWQGYLKGQWPIGRSTPNAIGARSMDRAVRTNQSTPSPILACVGEATARQIARDLDVPLSEITYPSPELGLSSDSEGLWALLEQNLTQSSSVLIVRGQTGRNWLRDTLTKHGMSVSSLSVYHREAADWSQAQCLALAQWANEYRNTGIWLVTSAEGLAAIEQQYEQHGLIGKPGFQPQAVVVVHQRLVAPVRQWLGHWIGMVSASGVAGATVPIFVSNPDDQSIMKAVVEL